MVAVTFFLLIWKTKFSVKDRMKKILIFVAVLFVFPMAYFSLMPDYSLASEQGEMSLFVGNERSGRLSNPDIPWWQSFVCFGYQKSTLCPDVPLHPIEEAKKSAGMAVSKGKTPKRNVTMRLEDIVR